MSKQMLVHLLIAATLALCAISEAAIEEKPLDIFKPKSGGLDITRNLVKERMAMGKINSIVCYECRVAVTEMRTVIESPKTEVLLQTMIDLQLCPQLGNYAQMCQELVDTQMPTIFEYLQVALAHPEEICQMMDFCPKKEKKNPLAQQQPKKISLHIDNQVRN